MHGVLGITENMLGEAVASFFVGIHAPFLRELEKKKELPCCLFLL